MPIVDSSTNTVVKDYTVEELVEKAREMRGWNMIALTAAGSGHTGGTLSIMDIAAALYLKHIRHDPRNPQWEDRDRVIWSAGHKAPALYVALGMAGYFDERPVTFHNEPLEGFEDVKGIEQVVLLRKFGSGFEGHPNRLELPGVELSAGSLGQGLGVACGCALAAKLDGKDYKVYVIMGDGEQDEGAVWEAVMFAAHHKLDNLVNIIDRNRLQIDGPTSDVLDISPLIAKYKAFGWEVLEVDGHDMAAILETLKTADAIEGKPVMILAHTIKGKGVAYAENVVGYHGIAPKGGRSGAESLDEALESLGVTDLFPPSRVDELLQIADRYQAVIDARVDAMVPKFKRDYWWNHADNMKVEMVPTRNGFGAAMAKLGAAPTSPALSGWITSTSPTARPRIPSASSASPPAASASRT